MNNDSIMSVLSSNSTNIQKLALDIRKRNKLSDIIFQQVTEIVNDVKTRGDSAIVEYAEKFDGVSLTNDSIKINSDYIKLAYEKADPDQIKALSIAKDRITTIQSSIMSSISSISADHDGCSIRYSPKPIDSVGCYIPGGRAVYPSSLLMSILPAKIANVPRIFICTPSTKTNGIDPLLLAACYMCDVSEVYQIGGAQAISAMAFGTESIVPASKIIGAGGSYVTAAKMIVSTDVSIDLPAGPTELLILADDHADPYSLAFDLVSQAEHGDDSLCGLVSVSSSMINSVLDALPYALESNPRSKLAKSSLSNNGFLLQVENYSEAVSFINYFAPEHLQICTSEPEQIEKQITSAGLILLGNNTPTSATDYLVGTNHILPTMGKASTYSGLSVLNFLKLTGIVECDISWLKDNLPFITSLASSEGLLGHSNSIKYRVDNSVE